MNASPQPTVSTTSTAKPSTATAQSAVWMTAPRSPSVTAITLRSRMP